MNDDTKRLNILLVEDDASLSDLIRTALEQSKNHCNLHTVGTGRNTARYLRGDGAYSAAPKPDLVFFDLSSIDQTRLKILDQVRAVVSNRDIPLVLLTTPESEQIIDDTYNQDGGSVVFSAIELDSFLRTMRARKPARFLDAVALIQKLGYVLVRVRTQSAEQDAETSVAAHA
jgi:CheY-like chemotaxis protein